MKKLFLSFAVLALTLTACKKDDEKPQVASDYDKTEVRLDFDFSEDYLNFFDVKVIGKNFDGEDISRTINATKGTFYFNSSATSGKTAISVRATMKNPMPEIDSSKDYIISKQFSGVIRAKVKDKEAYSSIKTFDFAGGTSSSTVKGESLIEHPDFLPRKAFDKYMSLSFDLKDGSVSVNAEELEYND